MNSIAITTECVADLPLRLYQDKGIDIIYYDIKTGEGVFRDTKEIDSQNVIEYMHGGMNKIYSVIPTANDFKHFWNKKLREYDEVIHICISAGVSEAYGNASLAKVKMGRDGGKVHIIDSRHLSCGQGLIALEAARLRDEGVSCKDILKNIEDMLPRVSSSFLADNANYLYYNGKVGKGVMNVCRLFHIHPVIALINGKMMVEKIYIGNYRSSLKKYIKSVYKRTKNIDTSYGFMAFAGCNEDLLEMAENEIEHWVTFEKSYKQAASATVSANCGPSTIGLFFVKRG